MKNQYLGDIGDYGKYGLLRYLSSFGIGIGINWYRTADDLSNDGKINRYLLNDRERDYDPVVFDALRGLAFREDKDLSAIRAAGLIPGAIYYEDELSTNAIPWKERKSIRRQWHMNALKTLADADLVFADPDTGTTQKGTGKGADQYAETGELADYFRRGQDIVYYCHRARRSEASWNEKKREMLTHIPEAVIYVLTFHRGMQRSYIFAVHPCRAAQYRPIIDGFLASAWGMGLRGKPAPFTEEPVSYIE